MQTSAVVNLEQVLFRFGSKRAPDYRHFPSVGQALSLAEIDEFGRQECPPYSFRKKGFAS